MIISPSGSCIWLNGHCRSIRNGQNSREPVWLCWNWVRNRVNRSKHQLWASGDSLGWTGNILWNILSARLRLTSGSACGSASTGIFLGIFFGAAGGAAYGSAGLGLKGLIYGARGRHSSSTSSAHGYDWANSAESSGGVCVLPPSPMKLILASVSLYGWALHNGMIKTCFWQLWKFGYLPKHFCFLTNGALIPIVGGRNHWWWLWNTQRG
jgi:hypothetical protein